jgi:hypothetical protein
MAARSAAWFWDWRVKNDTSDTISWDTKSNSVPDSQKSVYEKITRKVNPNEPKPVLRWDNYKKMSQTYLAATTPWRACVRLLGEWALSAKADRITQRV